MALLEPYLRPHAAHASALVNHMQKENGTVFAPRWHSSPSRLGLVLDPF